MASSPPPGFPVLSAKALYITGDANASAEEFATARRWSNTNVSSSPAIIVQPATEDDITALVAHAKRHKFKLIPAAGGHGSFVPISSSTLYMDMILFDKISLDETKGEVVLGGGVLAGQVLAHLAAKGWYTTVPNANAVGMAGFVLGGGSSSFNALHGMAVDNLVSATIITADGKVRVLSSESRGEEGRLWDVLRGAGYGFGVITELTLKAWWISDLGLDDGKLWTRRLVFPPSQTGVQAAAELFTTLQSSPSRHLSTVLFFARAPPTAPNPGAPMIMLLLTFLGPAADAERAVAVSFDSKYTSCALVAETTAAEIAKMNDAAAPMSRHGGWKENYSIWSHPLSSKKIVEAFESWIELGERVPEAKAGSYVVLAAKNPAGMLEGDREGRTFFPREVRGRGVFVQVVPWWSAPEAEDQARAWAEAMLETLYVGRQGGDGPGQEEVGVKGFAANLYKGVDVGRVWPEAKVKEIERVKGMWDPEGVFWCPIVDGV